MSLFHIIRFPYYCLHDKEVFPLWTKKQLHPEPFMANVLILVQIPIGSTSKT